MAVIGTYPLISVIIPVFNCRQYIDQCIQSVLSQTYKNLEVIIIDDGSTDGSGEICDRYKNMDIRVKVIHMENRGLVNARKTGVRHSCGEYIGFVDADDWIDVNMYEKMIKEYLSDNPDLLCCGFRMVKNKGIYEVQNNVAEGIYRGRDLEKIYSSMLFDDIECKPTIIQSVWSKLFKRDVLKEVIEKVDPRLTYGEDAAITYPFLLKTNTIYVTNQCLYYYRKDIPSMTNSDNSKIFLKIKLLYEYLKKEFERYPSSYQLLLQTQMYLFQFIQKGLETEFNLKIQSLYFPPEEVMVFHKIVIYGAGAVGQSYYERLCLHDRSCISGWIDSKLEGNYIYNVRISGIKDLKNMDYDVVLIAVKDEIVVQNIKENLLNEGIEERKIVWRRPETGHRFVRLDYC